MSALTSDGDASALETLKSECWSLQTDETELDTVLHDLACAITLTKEDPTSSPQGYLRIRDLRCVDAFNHQTLLIVKSLPDVQCCIEVADPSKTGKFQLKITTDNYSELKAFLSPANSFMYSCVEDVLCKGIHS
ncbi:hypothetical protein NECAME_14929, partial [Necator americanus]